MSCAELLAREIFVHKEGSETRPLSADEIEWSLESVLGAVTETQWVPNPSFTGVAPTSD